MVSSPGWLTPRQIVIARFPGKWSPVTNGSVSDRERGREGGDSGACAAAAGADARKGTERSPLLSIAGELRVLVQATATSNERGKKPCCRHTLSRPRLAKVKKLARCLRQHTAQPPAQTPSHLVSSRLLLVAQRGIRTSVVQGNAHVRSSISPHGVYNELLPPFVPRISTR